MKTEFLSVASHQLRTPLGSMKWNLESLLAGDAGVLKKDIKVILKDVYDSNKRMLTLVNDLLNVSRIDQGRIKDDPKETDIKELIDASIREIGPLAKQKDVEISTQIASKLPHITLDPTRFYEVIKNLLSNGVKYNKPGGMVTINVEHSGDFVSIKVTDTGMGIPRNDQPKIFSKFFRAKNAVVSETEGTGLGLFVVKSYVEGWGGTVECKSTEGKGTEFTLRIPRKVHTIVTTREKA